MRRLARGLALLLPLCLLALPAHAQQTEWGATEFENSGAAAAQEPFLRGLLMLHSFEYDDARSAFQTAQRIDPDFAMAHWGEAMTHNHPIWMEQDRTAALKALRDFAPTPEGRLEKAATERETTYLRTLHVLYGAGTDNPQGKEARDDAYEDARSVFGTTQTHATDPSVTTGYAPYMRWYLPVASVIETRQWDRIEARIAAMDIQADSLGTRGAVTLHAGRGLAAAHQNNLSAARSALATAEAALGDVDEAALRIQVEELRGLIALKAEETAAALDHLRTAAALEAERPLDYGPTFPPKPAHELYGEALLSLDRPADALTQFAKTLERYPDRALSLWGTARAAAEAGAPEVAAKAQSTLAAQWKNADAPVRQRLDALADNPDARPPQSR